MTISIKDPEADREVRQLAALMGASITEAVVEAAREKRKRLQLRQKTQNSATLKRVEELVSYAATLPVLDNRTPDEIIGYDDNGLPS